jgi:hypothetical protein
MQMQGHLTAQEIRAAIRVLPITHANLVALCAAVAEYAADAGFAHVSNMDVVSEHLDAASDACDGCYVMTADEREAA